MNELNTAVESDKNNEIAKPIVDSTTNEANTDDSDLDYVPVGLRALTSVEFFRLFFLVAIVTAMLTLPFWYSQNDKPKASTETHAK